MRNNLTFQNNIFKEEIKMEEMKVGMEVVEAAAKVFAEEGVEEVVEAGTGFGKKALIATIVTAGVVVVVGYGVAKFIKDKKAKKNDIDATCEEVAAKEAIPEADVE
jgi:hypothetical protein